MTDVLAAGDSFRGSRSPPTSTRRRVYPIAALTRSANAAAAAAFVDYVLSPDGVAVLTAAGFRQP